MSINHPETHHKPTTNTNTNQPAPPSQAPRSSLLTAIGTGGWFSNGHIWAMALKGLENDDSWCLIDG